MFLEVIVLQNTKKSDFLQNKETYFFPLMAKFQGKPFLVLAVMVPNVWTMNHSKYFISRIDYIN